MIKDTYYNSIEEMEQDHWSFSYDEDLYTIETQQGGVRFTNIGSVPFLEDGSNNGGKSVYAGTAFEALVEEDPANGTSITGTGFSGVYAVEMTLQHNISTMRSVSTYATLRFGPLSSPTAVSKPWLEMRLYNGKINIVRTVDGVRSDIDKLGGIALRPDLEWKLKIVMNTVDRTYSVYINNVQVLAAVDLPFQQGTTGKYLPDFAFYMMDANNVGSYVWIKNIKIYEIERDTADARYQAVMEALSAAPQAIAENPDAVTANLTLPVLEGLTWQTTDADVITAQGVVTQGDENREAELYVTASSAALNGRAYSYRKNYHRQVPAAGGGSGDNSGSSEWALSPITLQDGQATLTVYNESGRYEEEPLLILTAYDGSGRVVGCDLRAVQQQEELVWTVPPGAYGVSAYLWDTALRPLTGKSVG